MFARLYYDELWISLLNHRLELTQRFASDMNASFNCAGHTFLSENLLLHNGIQETGTINLVDAFFDPGMARADPLVIDEILIGQANQAANQADIFVIEEVRTNLFGVPIAGEGRDREGKTKVPSGNLGGPISTPKRFSNPPKCKVYSSSSSHSSRGSSRPASNS